MPTVVEPHKKGLSGYKPTIAVAMSNYIEAGSIIALATSLTLWQPQPQPYLPGADRATRDAAARHLGTGARPSLTTS